MEKHSSNLAADQALAAFETELGETTLYRATGRFLAAQGLEEVPLDTWGLVALTPTRLVFRRFPQSHPLFGGKTEDRRWEIPRGRFDACQPRLQGLVSRWLSGTPDHIAFTGPGVLLALETADDLRKLPSVWDQGPAG